MFMQKDDSQAHTEKRIDEISQAGFNNVPGIDCPDIREPVYADEKSRGRVHSKDTRSGNSLTEFLPLVSKQNEDNQCKKGPEYAVTD
jgi:hypothetical protein